MLLSVSDPLKGTLRLIMCFRAAINGDDSILHFDDCASRNESNYCQYGSSNDQQVRRKKPLIAHARIV